MRSTDTRRTRNSTADDKRSEQRPEDALRSVGLRLVAGHSENQATLASEKPGVRATALSLSTSVSHATTSTRSLDLFAAVLGSAWHPIEPGLRRAAEHQHDVAFHDVRLHTGTQAIAAARSIGADAFTTGNHIVLDSEAVAANTRRGENLIRHELAHVAQQRRGGAVGVVQRSEKSLREVQAVRSPTVEGAKQSLDDDRRQLDRRIAARKVDIQTVIDAANRRLAVLAAQVDSLTTKLANAEAEFQQLSGLPTPTDSKAAGRAKKVLNGAKKERDGLAGNTKRAKASHEQVRARIDALTLAHGRVAADVAANAEPKGVSEGKRKDVAETFGRIQRKEKDLTGNESRWHRLDDLIASVGVEKDLATSGLSAAHLKALLAQESGDLTQDDREGKITGIAQMGPDEEALAGGKPGDRMDERKAVPLAAKVLSTYAANLDKGLDKNVKLTAKERTRFVMAAYNIGYPTVIEAQRRAIRKSGASTIGGDTWQSLIDGGEKSALMRAIEVMYVGPKWPPKKQREKFKETTDYVPLIESRVP